MSRHMFAFNNVLTVDNFYAQLGHLFEALKCTDMDSVRYMDCHVEGLNTEVFTRVFLLKPGFFSSP